MAFNAPSSYTLAKNRPYSPQQWTRPGDWIAITDDPNKIQFLVCDGPSNQVAVYTAFTRVSGAQNLLIEWGDGNTDTVTTTSATYTNHTYTTGGTACSLGYNTWKITVTLTGSGSSTVQTCAVRKVQTYNGVTPVSQTTVGLLEAYYGNTIGQNLTTTGTSMYGTGAVNWYPLFNYCKLPATLLSPSAADMFNSCSGLYTVVMPTSWSSCTAANTMFQGCASLQSITFPSDMTGLTTLTSAFNGCRNLQSITLPPSLTSVTSLNQTFQNCQQLGSIDLPAMSSCTDWTATFSGCSNLLWIRIAAFTSTAQALTFTGTFGTLTSLQWLWLPASVVAGTTFSTFVIVNNTLQALTLPANFNTTSLQINCGSLTSLQLPSTMSALTSLNLSGCASLTDVTLPTTVGASISINFANCVALTSITIPSGWTISSLSGAFNGCSSLISAILPNNAQNTITTASNCFSNCFNLQTVVLPTSMNPAPTVQSFFSGCVNLRSVTLPDFGTGNINFSSFFSGCSSLQKVTFLGGFGAGSSSYGSAFQNCTALTSITLPTSSVSNAYNSMFNGCASLQSVTLGTAANTAASNCSGMFANCPNLKTITNLNNLGSSSTAGSLINCTTFATGGTAQVTSMSFQQRISKLELQGTATNRSLLNSLRLTNTGGSQWTGTSPQISVAYTDMSTANLVTLFNDMAAQGNVTSKTIDITSATGAAGLTASDRLIITSKGWTITG